MYFLVIFLLISTFLDSALVDGSSVKVNQLSDISTSFFLLNTQTLFKIEPDNPFDLAYSSIYNSWMGVCKKEDKIYFIVHQARGDNKKKLSDYQKDLRNDILFFGLNVSKFLYEGFYRDSLTGNIFKFDSQREYQVGSASQVPLIWQLNHTCDDGEAPIQIPSKPVFTTQYNLSAFSFANQEKLEHLHHTQYILLYLEEGLQFSLRAQKGISEDLVLLPFATDASSVCEDKESYFLAHDQAAVPVIIIDSTGSSKIKIYPTKNLDQTYYSDGKNLYKKIKEDGLEFFRKCSFVLEDESPDHFIDYQNRISVDGSQKFHTFLDVVVNHKKAENYFDRIKRAFLLYTSLFYRCCYNKIMACRIKLSKRWI